MDNTANNIYVTGVQLELGAVATPFEHLGIDQDLARCQRYYWEESLVSRFRSSHDFRLLFSDFDCSEAEALDGAEDGHRRIWSI